MTDETTLKAELLKQAEMFAACAESCRIAANDTEMTPKPRDSGFLAGKAVAYKEGAEILRKLAERLCST